MDKILCSNATLICNNIPPTLSRFKITEIFSQYGSLLGEGIYFGRRTINGFYVRYKHLKDAIIALEELKDEEKCGYDFKLTLSKLDELKYKATKGNKKAIAELKAACQKNPKNITDDNLTIDIINQLSTANLDVQKKNVEQELLNEKEIEIIKKEKKNEKGKEKSFILDLLTEEPKEEEPEDPYKEVKEGLKSYIKLNALCMYNFNENNEYDNFVVPVFPRISTK